MYLESRRSELAARTFELHADRISKFVEWCRDNGIDDMNDVSARTVHDFYLDMQEGLSQSTASARLVTIRLFIEFCVGLDAVVRGVPDRIIIPDRNETPRSTMLPVDDAEAILEHLSRFDYASTRHALLLTLWHTGVRTGTARGLDVQDVELSDQRLRVRHRPETDTPLKNKSRAERYIAISERVTRVLDDYVANKRPSTTDEYGRDPLFATPEGRMSRNTLRRHCYAATRPCQYGETCPVGREPDSCEAVGDVTDARKCPESLSGHPVRRGSITHHLREDVPQQVVSDRMDVSADVLEEHYDQRTEDEKAEQRREYLDNV